MNDFRIYLEYLRINFKSGLQYKGWPLQCVQVIFQVVMQPVAVYFTFERFGNVGEWSLERIMLIYGIAITSFGLAELFSRGYDYFPWKIRTGDFDRILLRPRSTFVQIVGSYFHLHRAARVLSGVLLMSICLWRLNIYITVEKAAILILALLGGYFAYTGVFILTSSIAFFTISALDWIYIFTNCSYEVTRCPHDYLPGWLKNMFTFFMPMLVISYYPASAICDWGEPGWSGWLALPSGLLSLLISLAAWQFGVRYYKSTGS